VQPLSALFTAVRISPTMFCPLPPLSHREAGALPSTMPTTVRISSTVTTLSRLQSPTQGTGVAVGVGVCGGVAVGVTVAVAVSVTVGVGVADGCAVEVSVGLHRTTRIAEAVGVGVESGAPHGPSYNLETPATALSQSFGYVFPSQPQTGTKLSLQISGSNTHAPSTSPPPHVPEGKSQNSPTPQSVPSLPPHTIGVAVGVAGDGVDWDQARELTPTIGAITMARTNCLRLHTLVASLAPERTSDNSPIPIGKR